MSDFMDISTSHIARKDFRCIWCGEGITKGEKYIRQVGKFEGDFQSNHWHLECFDYATTYDDIQDGFSPYDNPRPEMAPNLPRSVSDSGDKQPTV